MAISFSTFAFNKCFKVSLSWFSLVLPMATTKSKKASKPAFCPGEPSWDNPSISLVDHKQICSEQTTQKIHHLTCYTPTHPVVIPELSEHDSPRCRRRAPQHFDSLPFSDLQPLLLTIRHTISLKSTGSALNNNLDSLSLLSHTR